TDTGAPAQPITPAPTSPAATGSASGGALATGTYSYRVTALKGVVESLGSTEVSATVTGPNASVPLSSPAVAGAARYRAYRGTTAGGENVYYTVAAAATPTVTFTDVNGSNVLAGLPPTLGQRAQGGGAAVAHQHGSYIALAAPTLSFNFSL